MYTKLTAKGGEAEIVNWTNGPNSFVVVAMLEADDFEAKEELTRLLKNSAGKLDKDNKGAALVLEKLGIEVEKTSKSGKAGQANGKDDDASSGKQSGKAKKEKREKKRKV